MLIRRLAFSLLFLAMAGCASSVVISMGDRSVTGKPAFLSHAGLSGSSPDEAALNIGGKTVLVSEGYIKWPASVLVNDPASWKTLNLPPNWKRLEVDEVAEGLVVVVDDCKLATIRPAI